MDHILVTDDEAALRKTLSSVLEDEGYRVSVAGSRGEARAILDSDPPDLVLLDVWLGEEDGIRVLGEILKDPDPPAVVVMSGHGTIETAVRALKSGAFDYIEKPFSLDRVLTVAGNALRQRALERENRDLRERITVQSELVGHSPAMERLRELIARVAPTEGWVLVSGENGTGKELVARAIHRASQRASGPFVDINCAAIPEPLIESELFGHERGAFTGAHSLRKGKFEQASGGTLFLDEVGDMALATQAKLLRVLQERAVVRVGGSRSIPLDVRVVAASNRNLSEMIASRLFGEDLFYRLNVVQVPVPPLRDHREDIPGLVEHFVRLLSRDSGHRPKEFSPGALSRLGAHSWPGNVRELKNLVERLLILVPGPVVGEGDLRGMLPGSLPDLAPEAVPQPELPLREARDRFERSYVMEVLARCGGNIARASARLGVDRTSLHRKIRIWEGGEKEDGKE